MKKATLILVLSMFGVASWLGYSANQRRLSALAVLNAAGTTFQKWSRGGLRRSEVDFQDQVVRWFNYPGVIVTGLSETVNQMQLIDAIAELGPATLVLRIDGVFEQEFMEKLRSVTKLEYLDFESSPKITDKNISALKGHPNLKVIMLRRAPISLASLDTFRSLPRLEALAIDPIAMSESEIAEMKKSLPNIKFIP